MNKSFKKLLCCSFLWSLAFLFFLGLLTDYEHAGDCDMKVTGTILHLEEIDGDKYPVYMLDDLPMTKYISFSVRRGSRPVSLDGHYIGTKVELNYSKEYDVLYTNAQIMIYKVCKVIVVIVGLINLLYWIKLIVFVYFFIKMFASNNSSGEVISLIKNENSIDLHKNI